MRVFKSVQRLTLYENLIPKVQVAACGTSAHLWLPAGHKALSELGRVLPVLLTSLAACAAPVPGHSLLARAPPQGPALRTSRFPSSERKRVETGTQIRSLALSKTLACPNIYVGMRARSAVLSLSLHTVSFVIRRVRYLTEKGSSGVHFCPICLPCAGFPFPFRFLN